MQHPGVRQVDEELAVRPANVQHAVRVIHRGDVRRLGSCQTQTQLSQLSRTDGDTQVDSQVCVLPVMKLAVELSQQLSGGSPHVTMETRKL